MAKMGGCNAQFENFNKAQGVNRVAPGTSARNNLSKGGHNKNAAGSDKWGKSPALRSGKASMIKEK